MIEQVLNRNNMMRAYRQVLSNQGSAGVDGMFVKGLYAHMSKNREQIESDIRSRKYLPQAILGIEISPAPRYIFRTLQPLALDLQSPPFDCGYKSRTKKCQLQNGASVR